MTDKLYIEMLDKKLIEEVNEHLESGTVEGLADISEVMHAILDYKCISMEEYKLARN